MGELLTVNKVLFLTMVVVIATMAFASQASTATLEARQDMEIERRLSSYESPRDCRFSTEFQADGSRNWQSDSLDSGALQANALFELQQKFGYNTYAQNHAGDDVRVNRWNIALQRFADDCIIEGVRLLDAGNTDGEGRTGHHYIRRGFKILKWGFDRQSDNGSFEQSVVIIPDEVKRNQSLNHNTTSFLAYSSRSLYLLEESAHDATYAGQIDADRAKLLASAENLINRPVSSTNSANGWSRAIAEDTALAHRFFLKALALGMTAKLNDLHTVQDNELMVKAKQQVAGGMQRQIGSNSNPSPHTADHGAFQEKYKPDGEPGTDTGYGANSLEYAQLWYVHFPGYEDYAELRAKIEKGNDWLASRILDDGYITVTGNTRTCTGETNDTGEQKTPHYDKAVRAFVGWEYLDAPNEEDLQVLASRMDAYYAAHNQGDLCIHDG